MSGARQGARVFLALSLGAALADEVATRVRATLDPDAFRPSRPEGLHLTLVFVGALARERLEDVAEVLDASLGERPGPLLALAGTGAFPEWSRPRVLWVGVRERAAVGRLLDLRAAVLAGLARAGVGVEACEAGTFQPHVTVARGRADPARPRRDHGPAPEAFAGLCFEHDWDPPALVLFESRSGPGGSRYDPLRRFPFVNRD